MMSHTDTPDTAAAFVPPIPDLDATAAQALFGRAFRTRERGRPLASRLASHAVATVHPSALLRAPDEETRHRETARFIDDLKVAASLLEE